MPLNCHRPTTRQPPAGNGAPELALPLPMNADHAITRTSRLARNGFGDCGSSLS